MSNYYNKNNKYHEPIYYKKSKAAKMAENDYQDYSISDTTVSYKKHYDSSHDSRDEIKKYKTKFDSDIEYENAYDYDYTSDEYDCNCWDQTNNKHNRKYEYSSEDTMYESIPVHKGRQKHSETDTVNEEEYSNSDFSIRRPQRPKRSQYSYHGQDRKRHNRVYMRDKNKNIETTDSEINYYQRDADVYVARQPISNHIFKYNQQNKDLEQSNDQTPSNSEKQKIHEKNNINKFETEHPIYATHSISDITEYSTEKLLSIIDYNKNVISQRQNKDNKDGIERENSGLVYVPVIFQNKFNSKQKIGPSKLSLKSPKEVKPLQKDYEIFVAGDLEQTNIFHGSHNSPTEINERKTPSQTKKSSIISTAFRRLTGNKSNLQVNETDYPVKKSYIKVAPKNRKSKVKSTTSLGKASKSTTHMSKTKKQSKEDLGTNETRASKVSHQPDSSHLPMHRSQCGSSSHNVEPTAHNEHIAHSAKHEGQSNNGHVNRTSSLKEIWTNHSAIPQKKSGILKENLKSHVGEETERTPAALRQSTKSHQEDHQTSAMLKKHRNSRDEQSTAVGDDHGGIHPTSKSNIGDVPSKSSLTKERRKSEHLEQKSIRNKPHSSLVENVRKSSIDKNDQKDSAHSINKDHKKSYVDNKHQRSSKVGDVRKTPSDDKQHHKLSKVKSGLASPHQEDRKHLYGEKTGGVEHSRKTNDNFKEEIHNTERTSKTEGTEKKSKTSILSKRDELPPPDPRKSSPPDPRKSSPPDPHKSSPPEKHKSSIKSFLRKRKEKKNKHNLPQSTDSTESVNPSQYELRKQESDKSLFESPGVCDSSTQPFGYNIVPPLVCVFQVAQFFLGSTMHEKLMEVVNHYYKN